MSSRDRPAAVDAALARACVYHLLSVGFLPPTLRRLDEIGARDRFRPVTAALEHLDRASGGTRLAPAAARLAALVLDDDDRTASDYWRLFGHATRGLVCACETEYGPAHGFRQPQELADISGYYLAFGLRPVEGLDARGDHIACECEFMDFLSRKQAHLLDRLEAEPDLADTLEATNAAERSFLRDHLGRFARAFAGNIAAEDGDGLYGALGRLLARFVEAECARVGVEAGPADLRVTAEEVDETPMACESSEQLIQIQRRR